MAEKPIVTNAMRLLKAAGIVFEVKTYEVDEKDLSGVHVAQVCGLDPSKPAARFPARSGCVWRKPSGR